MMTQETGRQVARCESAPAGHRVSSAGPRDREQLVGADHASFGTAMCEVQRLRSGGVGQDEMTAGVTASSSWAFSFQAKCGGEAVIREAFGEQTASGLVSESVSSSLIPVLRLRSSREFASDPGTRPASLKA
eukprot:1793563-Rhodomonas_salina.1